MSPSLFLRKAKKKKRYSRRLPFDLTMRVESLILYQLQKFCRTRRINAESRDYAGCCPTLMLQIVTYCRVLLTLKVEYITELFNIFGYI